MLDAFTEGYYALDAEWRFLELNAASEVHFGRRASELTGQDFWEATGILPGSPVGTFFRSGAAGSQPLRFEFESRLRPGDWFEGRVHPRTGGGLDVYFRDITYRKRAEQALRASEEKFAKAFHGNSAAMAITRLEDGRYIEVNDCWVEATGFRREEAVGRTTADLSVWAHPEDRQAFTHRLRECGVVAGAEDQFLRASGERWIGLVSSQLSEIDGEEVIISSVLDITERKNAERAARRSQRLLRSTMDNSRP